MAGYPDTCAICGSEAKQYGDKFIPAYECPRCGRYDYDATLGWVKPETVSHEVLLAGWIREQNNAGITFVRITVENSQRLASGRLPRLRYRADKALLIVGRQNTLKVPLNLQVTARDPAFQAETYSALEDEAMLLLQMLLEEGCLRGFEDNRTHKVVSALMTVKGVLKAEELLSPASSSSQGFVAMWFNKELDDVWANGFHRGVTAAGYRPVRIDKEDYVGGISDEIMSEIRKSRFVVVDYTGHRGGVYFEAGFALGLNLIVIPTCRTSDIDELHFDIRHLNTLQWETPQQLAAELCSRIIAVVGRGPEAVEL
jgi:hypothetical protein